MPNGSCGYLSGSWQHQSWRKLKEEERWKGDTRRKSLWAPSVPPCLSHLVAEMWEQLLVVISFLLFKNGFEFGRQMRIARESKRHLRQKLCTHLLVIKSEPAPQLIAFYFLLNQLFLCSILSPSLCHAFLYLSLHLVHFPLQSSLTPYFYCLHVIAAS